MSTGPEPHGAAAKSKKLRSLLLRMIGLRVFPTRERRARVDEQVKVELPIDSGNAERTTAFPRCENILLELRVNHAGYLKRTAVGVTLRFLGPARGCCGGNPVEWCDRTRCVLRS